MTYTTAILASDFSSRTTDVLRDQWTAGKLRHLIAALDGQPVAIVIDSYTGSTLVGVTLERLVGKMHGSGHNVVIASTLPDGTVQRTAYRTEALGLTIIPLAPEDGTKGAKWVALDTYREEASAVIRLANAKMTAAGREGGWGRWETLALADGVSAFYHPQPQGGVIARDNRPWSTTITLRELAATACEDCATQDGRPSPTLGMTLCPRCARNRGVLSTLPA